MNKILVTLLALIGGSCISFAQMETGRVSDTAEDTLRIENEIVAVDTGFYQSVVRYDTVRYNLKMQRWIRTTEGVSQQIYSLPHLATLVFALLHLRFYLNSLIE